MSNPSGGPPNITAGTVYAAIMNTQHSAQSSDLVGTRLDACKDLMRNTLRGLQTHAQFLTPTGHFGYRSLDTACFRVAICLLETMTMAERSAVLSNPAEWKSISLTKKHIMTTNFSTQADLFSFLALLIARKSMHLQACYQFYNDNRSMIDSLPVKNTLADATAKMFGGVQEPNSDTSSGGDSHTFVLEEDTGHLQETHASTSNEESNEDDLTLSEHEAVLEDGPTLSIHTICDIAATYDMIHDNLTGLGCFGMLEGILTVDTHDSMVVVGFIAHNQAAPKDDLDALRRNIEDIIGILQCTRATK